MKGEAVVLCPAKINLHLEVGPIRPDGYHDLLSIFHMVDLYDTLWIRSLKSSDFCSVSGDFDFPQAENLIYKAIRRFQNAAGVKNGFDVRADKRIPAGAGLGGGSSDAAGTLRALNSMCGHILPEDILRDIGAGLGSDVPFFMTAPAAIVSGRGEHVEPLPPAEGLWCLLADPGIVVGTAEAYKRLDVSGQLQPLGGRDSIVAAYTDKGPCFRGFSNTFEDTVFKWYPLLRQIKGSLEQIGALRAGLSGSGSSVYGLFAEKKDALRAADLIKLPGVAFREVKMLARLPDAILQ